MQEIYRLVKRFAKYGFPVLILGESGTGKELVARAMHICSPWHTEPSVPVDCAALAPALIESELFGYERGAFTGADRPKMGLLESANLGTIFLDEVDSLTLDMQARLLRVLQEREIRPVGSTSCRAIKGQSSPHPTGTWSMKSRRTHFGKTCIFGWTSAGSESHPCETEKATFHY